MPSGVRFTGDWVPFIKAIDPVHFQQVLRREVRRATLKNALYVQREIRKRIQVGDYAPNSPLTLAIKAPKSKPLVVTGSLFGSITHELASDFRAFVGIKFGARGKDGADLVNVGLALHEGFTLQVTPAMRAAVFAKLARAKGKGGKGGRRSARTPGTRVPGTYVKGEGRVQGPAAATWVIPSRPFVRAVVEDGEVQRAIRANWEQAVARTFATI